MSTTYAKSLIQDISGGGLPSALQVSLTSCRGGKIVRFVAIMFSGASVGIILLVIVVLTQL